MKLLKFKLLSALLTSLMCGVSAFAFDSDNFLRQYRAEGYDMTFKDQHENILFLFIAVILLLMHKKINSKFEYKWAFRIASIAIIMFALINMALGANFLEGSQEALFIFLIICVILHFVFKHKFGRSKLYLSFYIFFCTIVIGIIFHNNVDYTKCDKMNEYPPEYGLQWRPFYQGFTDYNYFSSIEEKVNPYDSDNTLYDILWSDSHSYYHPFEILKKKGWSIIQNGEYKPRVFINPDKSLGYIQIRYGGGLMPPYCTVESASSLFSGYPIMGVCDIHIKDNLAVLATEKNDSIHLYIRDMDCEWKRPTFITLKDSILSLPDSLITNIIPENYVHVGLNRNFYEESASLHFHKDTIKRIEYGAKIRIKFHNSKAKDKVYSDDPNSFVEINYYGPHRLIRN